MQIINNSRVQKVIVSRSTSFTEHFFKDKRLGGAYIEINGRYPEKGYALNKVSSELAYILTGTGKLVTEKLTAVFSPTDAIFIPAKEKFYWEGNFSIYVVTAPAFDSKQHKFIS